MPPTGQFPTSAHCWDMKNWRMRPMMKGSSGFWTGFIRRRRGRYAKNIISRWRSRLAFTLTSKKKLQDYTIVDFIERNARDPLRKLSKDDRLVGSARLAQEYGTEPHNLCIAIAAAIYYENEEDEFARELTRIRKEEGIDAVLENVCGLDADGTLGMLVKSKISLMKEWGWIHE